LRSVNTAAGKPAAPDFHSAGQLADATVSWGAVSLSQASYVLADRYRLDDRIATGGMGEVWRAVDLVLGRPVAVKLLRDDYAQHPETLERFRAEARHTAAVSHPGIAQMYDYGEPRPGQPPFLVMELVEGVPLTELVARGPLDPARVMDMVAQAAAGLYAAHAVGLVHRDIKPGNLLVSPDGTVKITDFGIAYAAGSAPLTRTGALIGTPAYLAPERVTGASAGPASDLYSLGIVAYECLAGAQPFTGTPMEVALSHQYQPIPPLPPVVPLPVAALVAELTARDPAGRPADAGEVAARAVRLRDALNGAVAQEGPWLASQAGAGDADIPYGALPDAWPGPRETQLDGATLLDVGLQGSATHGAGMYRPRGARRHVARRRGPGRTLLVLAAAAVAVIVGLTGWMLVSGASGAPPAPRHQAAARHPARTRPTTAAAPTVPVNAGALIGQPYTDVVRQLRELGLQVSLTWVPSDQDHGTVLSVHPAGKVRVGTTVTLTVAAHHHHDGGDGGSGNGGGQ
jgi:eukaryotic-like serine/threonine-protein kinase